jgi:N-carbamoylputrescine amidase
MADPRGATPQAFTIGLVQMRATADPERNLATAVSGVREAAARGARVVCLPELFRSLYFCQTEDHANFDLAEPVPGPTTDAMGALARELEVAIVASVFERRAPGLYHNTAVVLDADGRVAGTYRKMHIPDDPLYYEKFYFTPGDLGFRAIPTRYGRVGTLVCWDQWYPEAARLTSLLGAPVLVYPTAIGWHPAEKEEHGPAQLDAWRTIQRAHAIANGVYVAAVNRIGHEGPAGGGIEFWGSSFLCDPFGQIVVEASASPGGRGGADEVDARSSSAPEVIVGEIDLQRLETVRRHWPFLRDRRVDAYGPIVERLLEG